MFKAIWTFIRNFAVTLHNNVVGPVKRWIENAKESKADGQDSSTASRVAMYTIFALLCVFAPSAAILIGILRVMVLMDVFGILGATFKDLSNMYAVKSA